MFFRKVDLSILRTITVLASGLRQVGLLYIAIGFLPRRLLYLCFVWERVASVVYHALRGVVMRVGPTSSGYYVLLYPFRGEVSNSKVLYFRRGAIGVGWYDYGSSRYSRSYRGRGPLSLLFVVYTILVVGSFRARLSPTLTLLVMGSCATDPFCELTIVSYVSLCKPIRELSGEASLYACRGQDPRASSTLILLVCRFFFSSYEESHLR